MSWWYGCFPPEFFRYERTPKGGPKCTLFLSLCIAGASVSTFIALAVKGANISTVESEVSAFDKSGTNGWSCDMVSKVTDEYSLDTNEGTSFTLVNVLETATECTENLKAVSDPCSGLSYAMTASPTFRGTSSLFVTDYASGDFIFYGSTLCCKLFRYEVAKGEVSVVFDAADSAYSAKNLAYDPSSGRYWLLDYRDASTHVLRSYRPDEGFIEVKSFADGCEDGSVAVDGEGVVWVARRCYGQLIYVYSSADIFEGVITQEKVQFMVSSQLDVTQDGDLVMAAFVGGTGTVTGAYFYEFDPLRNSTFTYLFSKSFNSGSNSWDSAHMSVGADGSFWLLSNSGGLANIDQDGSVLGEYDFRTPSSVDLGSDNILDPKDLAVASSALAIDLKGRAYFASDYVMYRFDPASGSLADLKSFTGTSGWFVCGALLEAEVPSDRSALLSACPLNGIKWQVLLNGKAFFGEAGAEAHATTGQGAASCGASGTYPAVCAVVSDLPPYICNRELPAKAVTYLGAASGSAHLVFAILVVTMSVMLSITNPPPPPSSGGGSGDLDEENKSGLLLGGVAYESELQQELAYLRAKVVAQEEQIECQDQMLLSHEKAFAVIEEKMAALYREARTTRGEIGGSVQQLAVRGVPLVGNGAKVKRFPASPSSTRSASVAF